MPRKPKAIPEITSTPPQAVYLTPEELSTRWGGRVSVKTLANRRSKGMGPPWEKLPPAGRTSPVVYRLDAVEAWERANTAANGPGGAPPPAASVG